MPNGTRFDPNPVNTSTTSYAKISGKYSGTTRIIKIPFPYWEIVYTVDPVAAIEPGSASGGSHSGVQGSYSGVIPEFTVQVTDAADPNRIYARSAPRVALTGTCGRQMTPGHGLKNSTKDRRVIILSSPRSC